MKLGSILAVQPWARHLICLCVIYLILKIWLQFLSSKKCDEIVRQWTWKYLALMKVPHLLFGMTFFFLSRLYKVIQEKVGGSASQAVHEDWPVSSHLDWWVIPDEDDEMCRACTMPQERAWCYPRTSKELVPRA